MSSSTPTQTIIFPPLPPIQGELILNVFTHKSLRQPSGSGDNERYAVLGEKAFEAAVTHCIFLRKPQFEKGKFEQERTNLTSDLQYRKWVEHYGLFEKLRFNPAVKEEIQTNEGIREIFHAYLGAVYSEPNGPTILNSWVFRLLTPLEEHHLLPENSDKQQLEQPRHQQTSTLGRSWSPRFSGSGLPQSDSLPLDPLPVKRKRSLTSHSPSQPSRPPAMILNSSSEKPPSTYLSKFNEICTRKRLNLEWSAEQTGPQHAPRWEVNCVVNGRIYGRGVGTSKQLAKEEAAVQAFHALGFDKE